MHFIVAASCSCSQVEHTSPVYPNLGEHKDFLLLQPSLMTHSSDDFIFSDTNLEQEIPTVESQFVEK